MCVLLAGAFLPRTAFAPTDYLVHLSFTAGALDTNDTTADLTFQGNAVIDFNSTVDTSCVVFNGVKVNISQIDLIIGEAPEVELCNSNATCSTIVRYVICQPAAFLIKYAVTRIGPFAALRALARPMQWTSDMNHPILLNAAGYCYSCSAAFLLTHISNGLQSNIPVLSIWLHFL